MKKRPKSSLLFVLPAAALAASSVAAATNPPAPAPASNPATPASILANELTSIAAQNDLSPKARARLITKTVQAAILAAIDGVNDPAEQMKRALDLATAAAAAVPSFATAITDGVLDVPAIAAASDAAALVKKAVFEGVKSAVFEDGEVRFDTDGQHKPGQNPPLFHGSSADAVVSPST